jgi:hypothetical protein
VLGAVGVFGSAELDVASAGSFTNNGLVVAAGRGTTILSGSGNVNNGIEESIAGGRLQIEAAGINRGQIIADGTVTTIENDITQQAGGSMTVKNNGSLEVTGNIHDGTIKIESGMLELDYLTSFEHLTATVDFTGQTGTIAFDGGTLSLSYSDIAHGLVVTNDYGPGETYTGTIALGGNYSAANFAVHGTEIVYTQHPTS